MGNLLYDSSMDAWLCSFRRTPFHRAHKGELASIRPDVLLGIACRAAIDSAGVSKDAFDDVMVGCAYPEGEQGLNIGRIGAYLAGLPVTTPGMTTNRLCGSSMQVVITAAGMIARGWGDLFLCAGVESMSRIQRGGFNRSEEPSLMESFPEAYISMGETAENVADRYGIERSRQEEFAFGSHQKAADATRNNAFSDALIEVESERGGIFQDGCIRPETTLKKMAALRPVFRKEGSVTAATSSPLTDGAVSMVIASNRAVELHGLDRIARIRSAAVTGCHPDEMGIGPINASQKALGRASISIDEVNVIELNEAFASQSLAVIDALNLDIDKVNLDGGAIAIGHPLGASGIRILGRAATILRRTGGQFALATMCIGGGMGIATVLEAPSNT